MAPSILKPFKITFYVLVILLVAAALWKFFVPLVAERADLVREHANLCRENDKISKDVAELRGQQTDFINDPEYIELVGRREGLLRKNEVVFDFSETRPRSRR